jgi:protein-S-isoprenylcysteine O-methyltransferase Ste14
MDATPVRTETTSAPQIRAAVRRWAVKSTLAVLLGAACLFAAAGRLDWTVGWVYVGVMVLNQAFNALVLGKRSPDLLAERSQVQAGTKAWDRLLSVLMAMVGPFSTWIVAGLGVRWNWGGAGGAGGISPAAQAAGMVLLALGSWLTLWAMASNRFFAATVRIQTERGHTVAQSGPYRFVRHPGYSGALLFVLATPLALGSAWAFIPAFLTAAVVVLRTALEDHTLQEELAGYREYAAGVPSRLVPGLW